MQPLPFSSANVHVTWIFHNQTNTKTAKNTAPIDFWNCKPLQYIHYKSDSFPAENKECYNQMKLAAEKIARAYDQISEVPTMKFDLAILSFCTYCRFSGKSWVYYTKTRHLTIVNEKQNNDKDSVRWWLIGIYFNLPWIAKKHGWQINALNCYCQITKKSSLNLICTHLKFRETYPQFWRLQGCIWKHWLCLIACQLSASNPTNKRIRWKLNFKNSNARLDADGLILIF